MSTSTVEPASVTQRRVPVGESVARDTPGWAAEGPLQPGVSEVKVLETTLSTKMGHDSHENYMSDHERIQSGTTGVSNRWPADPQAVSLESIGRPNCSPVGFEWENPLTAF